MGVKGMVDVVVLQVVEVARLPAAHRRERFVGGGFTLCLGVAFLRNGVGKIRRVAAGCMRISVGRAGRDRILVIYRLAVVVGD
jgi:hypothetical protein